MRFNWVNINALVDGLGKLRQPALCRGTKERVRNARVIIGRDVDSQRIFLLYGRKLLTALKPGELIEVPVLALEMDADTQELQFAVKMTRYIKGLCDYQGVR
jgi:hypothetical protein